MTASSTARASASPTLPGALPAASPAAGAALRSWMAPGPKPRSRSSRRASSSTRARGSASRPPARAGTGPRREPGPGRAQGDRPSRPADKARAPQRADPGDDGGAAGRLPRREGVGCPRGRAARRGRAVLGRRRHVHAGRHPAAGGPGPALPRLSQDGPCAGAAECAAAGRHLGGRGGLHRRRPRHGLLLRCGDRLGGREDRPARGTLRLHPGAGHPPYRTPQGRGLDPPAGRDGRHSRRPRRAP